MMDFIKKHKCEIALGIAIVGAVALGVVIGKRIGARQYIGREIISWLPTGKTISLGAAQAALELNVSNGSKFAFYKKGMDIIPLMIDEMGCMIYPKV